MRYSIWLLEMSSYWSQGWRSSCKGTHFIRALHDFLQERQYDMNTFQTPEEPNLQYLQDRWYPSILEAIDDDRSGYITISKVNRFMGMCPSEWR